MGTILPNPPPNLREEFKHRIKAMGGTKVVMVIQKALFENDLTQSNDRLSMPFSKINKGFLRESEREYLEQQNTMDVQFIECLFKFGKMMLRQWNMPKDTRKKCSIYLLRTE